ncbi:MAG: hypothetical protein K2N06_03070 [Oscillospiraceae bacterium]|nr:hypothetical protein [Oscillospiraceae bacterium]
MKTKSKFLTVFGYVIMAAVLLWLIISGATALIKNGSASPDDAQKGDVCEFTAFFADEAFEVKNTINFIPTGKEHYYLAMSEDGIVRFLVRAKPSWIDKNFPLSGFSESGGVKIKGRIVSMDYKLIQEAKDINNVLLRSETITEEESLNVYYYIDARYKEFGGLRLLCGAGIVVIGVLSFLGSRNGMLQSNNAVKIVFGVAAVGIALLTLYTLTVGGTGI